MPGPEFSPRPRRTRRGAALSLVFVTVLATGAGADALPHEPDAEQDHLVVRPIGATVDREDVARAAAEAVAEGESATQAAEEVVSRSGDRWGSVYGKEEYEQFQQSLDGEYTGVGLWARRSGDGRVEIARVQPGGPAAKAGVKAGDRLRTIDGSPVEGRPVTDVVALLRGNEGTEVDLGLQRDGRRWSESLIRTTLPSESVTVERLDGGTVKIKVVSFTRGSGKRVKDAVEHAPDGAGVLLDLRGNSGGLITEAVTAASAFLDGGLVATYDVNGEQLALYAEPGGDTERPVVALVDGGTMSAAEMVTGALKDRGRAVTVGSRTFGKGSVQMPSPLPDGSVAELTVGHYRTPEGREVDGKGIVPDVVPAEGESVQAEAESVLTGLGAGS
ncbi:S41 family peptidase [Streptomyces sp. NPDC047315]|uniref:S41 family peptidase n=1 Tax=Streptomyces sp. NPDC047315 TaxID=3155142 RepID=UPI0034014BBB